MANYAKYTKPAMGHMLKHYERAKDDQGEYLKFGNQEIDLERTGQNYNLAPKRDKSQLDFIHERLDEVHHLKRADVNVMCTWVVTAPKDLTKEQEEDFFKETYSFLKDKYKEENIVSAYVHMDETTPHMHFCFMPVVFDQKKQRNKLSAKECVTRNDLQHFHEELQQHLDEKGISCNVLNEATREGNKAIKELKQGMAQETLKNVHTAIEKGQDELLSIEANKSALKRQIRALNDFKNIQGEVLTKKQVKDIKTENIFLDGDRVKIKKSDLENLQKTALIGEQANDILGKALKYLEQAEKTLEKVEKSRKEPIPEHVERLELKRKLEKYDKALENCKPEVKKAFEKALKELITPKPKVLGMTKGYLELDR